MSLSLTTKFPLLAAGSSGDLLVLGGGGGSAKTGVKNSLKRCPLSGDGIGDGAVLGTGAEAVTSLSVSADGSEVACALQTTVDIYKITKDASAPFVDGQRLVLTGSNEPSQPIRSLRDVLRDAFPTMCDAAAFKEVRAELRKLGGATALLAELEAQDWVAKGKLTTGTEPTNIFARIARGETTQPGMEEETAKLGAASDRFVIACNDEDWNSDEIGWLGNSSLSKNHRFMVVRDLSWSLFNVLAFGLKGEAELREAVSMLEAMEAAATEFTANTAGWSKKVGLYFQVYGHASLNALHLHIVDLDATGPGFEAFKTKSLPLQAVLEVLREEINELPSAPAAADDEGPPLSQRPYVVRFSPDGAQLAVGMEDGGLFLFGRDADSGRWSPRWRRKVHGKEIKGCAFSADGVWLCTAAPDSKCLAWALGDDGVLAGEPSTVAQPSFFWHKEKANRRTKGAQWRCIAVGDAPVGGASPLLFGALNHVGGPGWVARCELKGGSCEAYTKVASSPLTALALAADGAFVAVGTSEGELFVLDSRTLSRLHKSEPHALFITSLLMCPADAPSGRAAITCAGDNTCILTPLPKEKLKSSRGLAFCLVVLVLLVSALLYFLSVDEGLKAA